jgi:Spy/CpxP family protein refolding chaperone
MRSLIPILILFALASAVEAQTPLYTARELRSVFGALLVDKDLQKEMRITPRQLQRMREIYLQYIDPATVVFSPWGRKNLGVTSGQIEQFRQMRFANSQETAKVLFDKSGKYQDREKLKKVKEIEAALSKKSLSILTPAQRRKFDQLKGKPYKLRNLTPPKPPRPKTNAELRAYLKYLIATDFPRKTAFGGLPNDDALQKELRLTPTQIQRMEQISLQYAEPASRVFSKWGVKHLGVTDAQLKQFDEMERKNALEKGKIWSNTSGKYNEQDRLKIMREMDVATKRRSLTILTPSQREKFASLKGKPYKLGTAPRPKPNTGQKAKGKAGARP